MAWNAHCKDVACAKGIKYAQICLFDRDGAVWADEDAHCQIPKVSFNDIKQMQTLPVGIGWKIGDTKFQAIVPPYETDYKIFVTKSPKGEEMAIVVVPPGQHRCVFVSGDCGTKANAIIPLVEHLLAELDNA